MATYTIIDETEAPAAVTNAAGKAPNENQKFALTVLDQLKVGDKATKIEFEEGDSRRGIKRALTTMAAKNNLKVDHYEVNDILYVKLLA